METCDFRTVARRRRCLFTVLATAAVLIAGSGRASAQLPSVETLTGSAEVGPHFQDVEDAIARFQARDAEGARKLLEEARKKTPRLAPAEVMLSILFYSIGQAQQANNELERAIKQEPKDPEAYLVLGDLSFREGRVTEAQLLFEHGLKLAEDYSGPQRRKKDLTARAHAGAAAVFEKRQQLKEARPHLEAWAKLEPEKSAPHQRLARALFEAGSRKEAYAELQLAAKADKTILQPEIMLASFYHVAGDKTKAEEWIKAASKRSKSTLTEVSVAQLLWQMGQNKDAQAHAESAVRAEPSNFDANMIRGMIARMVKDYDTAQRYFERAHLISPSNTQPLRLLALVLIEQKDDAAKKRALEYAEALVRAGRSIESASTLGWVQYKLGRNTEAERTFSPVFAAGQMNPEVAYFAAHVARDQGRTDVASKLLDFAVSTDQPFAYRDDAEKLKSKVKTQDTSIKKGSAPKPGAGSTPGSFSEPEPM